MVVNFVHSGRRSVVSLYKIDPYRRRDNVPNVRSPYPSASLTASPKARNAIVLKEALESRFEDFDPNGFGGLGGVWGFQTGRLGSRR